ARPQGWRRRPARERARHRRSGRAARLPGAAQDRAARRPRHRPRRCSTDPRLRAPMRRLALLALLWPFAGSVAAAEPEAARVEPPAQEARQDAVIALNFQDVELPVLAKFVSEVTGRNFIIDDRVRGKVTIISPTRITPDEAYLVFQSVLQVKGF